MKDYKQFSAIILVLVLIFPNVSSFSQETGKKVKTPVEVIKEVAAYFRLRLPSGGVTIVEKYEETPPVKINTELISWVVENLIKNSLEATNPKTGIIYLKIEYNPDQKNVMIIVEDNGRGVPPSEHKKIFAPGFTTKKRGWGLGLTLARRIVEEYHGGKINLKYSDPGIRTAFGIELPV